MKALVLVPDIPCARALGALWSPLGRVAESLRVVASGPRVAAALPAELEPLVYPVHEGCRLPAFFFGALVEHEAPDVVLAPGGQISASPAPALVLDLDPSQPAAEVVPLEDEDARPRVETVVGTPERRAALVREGLFTVQLAPHWFSAEGALTERGAQESVERLVAMARAAGGGQREVLAARRSQAGRRLLLLGGDAQLDAISPDVLSSYVVVATPASLPWLNANMGVARYVCVARPPSDPEQLRALRESRALLVTLGELDGALLSPRARGVVGVADVSPAGTPASGFSTELGIGAFSGDGDLGLALQWASWLEPTELTVGGLAGSAEEQALVEAVSRVKGAQGMRVVLVLPRAEERAEVPAWARS